MGTPVDVSRVPDKLLGLQVSLEQRGDSKPIPGGELNGFSYEEVDTAMQLVYGRFSHGQHIFDANVFNLADVRKWGKGLHHNTFVKSYGEEGVTISGVNLNGKKTKRKRIRSEYKGSSERSSSSSSPDLDDASDKGNSSDDATSNRNSSDDASDKGNSSDDATSNRNSSDDASDKTNPSAEFYIVDKIVGGPNQRGEYLVKWEGYLSNANT
jgi:hypothetical protein